MSKAVVPGSFDPVTFGHGEIVRRAAALFDEVIVCVAVNMNKKTLFTPAERRAFLEEYFADLPNVTVDASAGLVTDYAREKGCDVIVKGVRNAADFEYETNMEFFNRRLAPEVETVYLMSHPDHTHISSSAIRELAAYGSDISAFVPEMVEKALQDKLKGEHR